MPNVQAFKYLLRVDARSAYHAQAIATAFAGFADDNLEVGADRPSPQTPHNWPHLILARDRGPRIFEERKMNSPPTQMIGHDLSTIEWPTLLFDRFRYTLNVATESGRVCDALEAIAAWHQWLLVDQPDPNRRASIQHQRLLQDILDREGRPL